MLKRDYIKQHKKSVKIGGAILVLIVICVVVFFSQKEHKTANHRIPTNKIEHATTLMFSKLGRHAYSIKDYNEKQYLCERNKIVKRVNYNGMEMIPFNTNTSIQSNDILRYADGSKKASFGNIVYRSRQIDAERYYAYLKAHGYSAGNYIVTAGYFDGYFTKDGKTYRFLWIRNSKENGVLLFDTVNIKQIAKIEDIL